MPPAQSALAIAPPREIGIERAPGSVVYLMSTYGVSEAEALRRLNLQLLEPILDEALADEFSDDFAGSALDQANGGVIVVHSTNVERTRQALHDVRDAEHVRVVPAARYLKELSALGTEIDRQPNNTGAKNRVAETVVDVDENVMAVYQRAGAAEAGLGVDGRAVGQRVNAASQHPDLRVAAAVAVTGGVAVHRQLVTGSDLVKVLPNVPAAAPINTTSCMPKLCTIPMRGGMRLDFNRNTAAPVYPNGNALNASWDQCTNGFNMLDNRGWSNILTAGHCAVGPNKTGDTRTYSSYETGRIPVGYELPDFENAFVSGESAYPNDFAVQPYVSSAQSNYWLPPGKRNWVDSYCFSFEGTRTCTEGTFGITGLYQYSQIRTGWVVCGTGSADASSSGGYHANIGYSAGTRCGEVAELNSGARTNLCMRQGDSGGPLFSELDNKAYGILSNGSIKSGTCPSVPAGTEYSQCTPLTNVIVLGYTQTGYTFGVRNGSVQLTYSSGGVHPSERLTSPGRVKCA